MKKRIIKKYHLKDEIKGGLILAFMGLCIFTTLFYQAEKVEEERQQKENDAIQVAVILRDRKKKIITKKWRKEKMKVKNFYSKNQFILEDNKKAIFQSYNSIILQYNKEKKSLFLGKDWNYSNTTRKYLYLFIDEMLPYNESTKELINTKHANNRKEAIKKLINDKKIAVKNI